jgi:alkylhydroperoxidase/carboxymuconolactone decarboxylase family protein YurZ
VDPRLEELLRRLALNDETAVESTLGMPLSGLSGLDAKSSALVQLASLIALCSSESSYEWAVSAALAAGATDEEVVGVLLAVSPMVGTARASWASNDIAAALGHEIDRPDSD